MEGQLNSDSSSEEHVSKIHQGEYLTFILGDEAYGLDILKVREIRHYEITTKIANTSDCIKGVVDLRGEVVPIIDLRIMFGFESVNYNAFTVVIILNLKQRVVGIVVDGVSDVKNVKSNQVRSVPDIVSTIDTKYITGLASIDEKMFILVDIEKLLNSQEISSLNTILH